MVEQAQRAHHDDSPHVPFAAGMQTIEPLSWIVEQGIPGSWTDGTGER
jgi:hypothetical protein